MRRLVPGAIGILPAGALGVALFYHLTGELKIDDGAVVFLDRSGSASAEALRSAGLRIGIDDRVTHIDSSRFRGDLTAAFEAGTLPEVLLVCTNPDQIGGVLDSAVTLVERSFAAGELEGVNIPAIALCSNGIYFQRQRQLFIERLEEATVLGRLPDLWPDLMPRIVGRLLRGVSIQTGIRDGSGADALYVPGPRGITRVTGGDPAVRQRVATLCAARGAWFEVASSGSPTRVEFDKAMVNLASNLLGQLQALGEDGHFEELRVREIITPAREPAIRELVRHVFAIGCAVKAYNPREDFEEVLRTAIATALQHADHVPSSLQWVKLRLRQGKLTPELTPTETWLLDPLMRYARAAGLDESAAYFDGLRRKLLAKLTAAVTHV